MPTQVPDRVKAQRGKTLRCNGWQGERILRMLEDNLENGQDPSRLVVYGDDAFTGRQITMSAGGYQ